MPDKIVITGIGLTTPQGCGREISWQKIRAGISVNADFTLTSARAAPLENLNGLHRIYPLSLRTAQEALNDAGLVPGEWNPERVGCSVSISKPILNGPCISAPETVGQYLSEKFNIQGPVRNAVAACATGVHSIQMAARWLNDNLCDVALAGSAESCLHPLYLAGFRRMGVLSIFPRPFDFRRDGFVIGEGAGILVLERESDARARNVRIYAELAACSLGADTAHPVSFDPDGAAISRVLDRALNSAELNPDDVDYINAHGTGTHLNDIAETRALKKTLRAAALSVPVSSTKGSTGHLLGASASVEAALCCLSIRDGNVPPTANLNEPDPQCNLNLVRGNAQNIAVRTSVSLSYGFGGAVGAVVLRKLS